jgi:hypothetical protein
MAVHLYLSLIPEALIASMLEPDEFGAYYAIGSEKKSRGQAIFFEIDPQFRGSGFQVDEAIQRCVPHEDGSLNNRFISRFIVCWKIFRWKWFDACI